MGVVALALAVTNSKPNPNLTLTRPEPNNPNPILNPNSNPSPNANPSPSPLATQKIVPVEAPGRFPKYSPGPVAKKSLDSSLRELEQGFASERLAAASSCAEDLETVEASAAIARYGRATQTLNLHSNPFTPVTLNLHSNT